MKKLAALALLIPLAFGCSSSDPSEDPNVIDRNDGIVSQAELDKVPHFWAENNLPALEREQLQELADKICPILRDATSVSEANRRLERVIGPTGDASARQAIAISGAAAVMACGDHASAWTDA